LNAVALVPKELDGEIASTGFDVLRPVAGVDPRWISYLVRTEDFVDSMSALVQGALYPAIRSKDVRAYVAPLAPAAEQTRIANQLDNLLARIQSCNDRFDAILTMLKRFRQAVLDAAVRGLLSGENGVSSSRNPYSRVRLSEVADARLGKMLDKQKNTGNPTPYIGNINVRWFAFDLNNLQSINIEDKEKENLEIRDGDVFICEGGEPGRCAIWNLGPTKIVFQKALHRVRPAKERLLPQWLVYCMRHLTDTEQLKPLYTGTTIRHLTGASLSQVLIPLPEIKEQAEIVRRVEALFALADRIEARATAGKTHAQRLSPLTLAKAFRGELVEQDSQDEPASILLGRISSLRAMPIAKKKSKNPRQALAPRIIKEAVAMSKSRQDNDVKDKPYLADHLRRLGSAATAEVLFKASELTVADFYKQLAWEVTQGHIEDSGTTLEAPHAAG
jgi:type I restriction enzyme, S subunit